MVQKKQRGRPRKEDSARDADRQILVSAAADILQEGGAAALSARNVAERAGTAVGSVYAQFDSLEALRLEANAITMRQLRGALTDALAERTGGSTAERLLCLADAYLAFASAHHNAWAAMFERRTVEPPPAIAADISALFAVIEDVLRTDGRLDAAAIPVMAKALWSSVHGMVYLGNVGGLGPVRPEDVRPMIDVLVRSAVAGWSTVAPAPTRPPRA